MSHWKKAGRGAVTGAVVLLLTVGGLTACATGEAAPASVAPMSGSSDAATDSATDSPSATPSAIPPAVQTEHVGELSEQASGELTQQGLLVAFADSAGNTLPSEQGWYVVAQQPAAGADVTPGTVVRLILSPSVVATNHVGETSDQASAALTQQGLLVSFADAGGNVLPVEQGWSVIGQNPAAGASLRAGSSVRLILSPPPPPEPPAQQEAPAAPQAPAGGGATALCNDGSLSYSAHHQGTCSHHGGVAVWYK